MTYEEMVQRRAVGSVPPRPLTDAERQRRHRQYLLTTTDPRIWRPMSGDAGGDGFDRQLERVGGGLFRLR